MFCYKINLKTNDVYATTHSCNTAYTDSILPICPYADSKECDGFCGFEEDFEDAGVLVYMDRQPTHVHY